MEVMLKLGGIVALLDPHNLEGWLLLERNDFFVVVQGYYSPSNATGGISAVP